MSDRLIRAFAVAMAVVGGMAITMAIGLEGLQIGAPGLGTQQWAMIGLGSVLTMLALLAAVACRRGRRSIAIVCLKTGMAVFATAIGLASLQVVTIARRRLADEERIAKVAAIQELLRADHEIGYLYKPDLNVLIPHDLQWLDGDVEGITIQPITTDADGFDNHPDAIASQESPVEIIGLGDSFIDGAARTFYDFFRDRGQRYHSYAMHRQCPPQYNRILTRYVLDRRPERVFYGIFVNDFWETADFQLWQSSGEDWFAYHDQTWCGAPRTMPTSDVATQANDVLAEANEAFQVCKQAEIEFAVWLIPNKEFIVDGGESPVVTNVYDSLRDQLQARGVSVLDLRTVLADHSDRASLFWKQDAHWSHAGMQLAAEAYWDSIVSATALESSTPLSPDSPNP